MAAQARHRAFHVDRTGRATSLGRDACRTRDGVFLFLLSDEAPSAHHAAILLSLASRDTLIVWAESADAIHSDDRMVLSFDRDGFVTHHRTIGRGALGLEIDSAFPLRWDEAAGAFTLHASTAADHRTTRLQLYVDGANAGILDAGPVAVNPWSASIRYFYSGGSGAPGGGLQRVVFPIFAGDGAGSRLIHPLQAASPAPPPSTFASNFRTPIGDSVSLSMTPSSGFAYQYDPVDNAAYQVLTGAWTVGLPGATAAPASIDILCGLSGTEWLRVANGGALEFLPGAPAFAPYFGATASSGMTALSASAPGVSPSVTTTWVAPTAAPSPTGPAAPASYYTQAERAPFYGIDPADNALLTFAELKALDFSSSAPAFPLAPYGGVAPGPTGFAGMAAFEQQVLTTVRRNTIFGDLAGVLVGTPGPLGVSAIGAAAGCTAGPTGIFGPTAPLGPTGPTRAVVTPQGLLGHFDTDDGAWRDLTIGQAGQGAQTLVLTALGEAMRVALMSSELFLVVTDAGKFLDACSIRFCLDDNAFAQLTADGVVPAATVDSLRYLGGYTYQSERYFDAVLCPALGSTNFARYGAEVRRAAAQARLVVGGFTFDLSPYRWADNDTVLIFKYSNRPLRELVADAASWTAPGAFLAKSVTETQRDLLQFIDSAEQRAKTDANYRYFASTVCGNTGVNGGDEIWTGLLGLNCRVPLTALPPQLEGLAAGIDPTKFYAHHFGVNQSGIGLDGGTLGIDDSALFGLIDYDSPRDLYYQGKPYAFKVLTLHVLFANSQVANFASQIELLVADLFGERSALPGAVHGDNLVLNGVWQHRGGVDSYAFTDQDESVFQMASHVLDTVSVTDAQFLTVIPPKGSGRLVQSRFVLAGMIRWLALPRFDAFSFGGAPGDAAGGLSYGNLTIDMSFDPWSVATTPPTFKFDASNLALDLSRSAARAGSLYQRFPLRASGFVQADAGATPESLGFLRTFSPLAPASLEKGWFGIECSLNLGSPGSLVDSTGFYADLLIAWAPDADQSRTWIGIKLPGATSSGRPTVTIEGPLQLSMATIEFLVTDADDPATTAYMLKLSSIALSFLGKSFPPGGRVDAMLFGDPNPAAATTSLGWYAAYDKDG
jgi:hypothetical protein